MINVIKYKVTIYLDGNLCHEQIFDQLWNATEWMENYAGQCFTGYVAEIKNGKEKQLYGF